jgi:thiol:disulfide interchange protein
VLGYVAAQRALRRVTPATTNLPTRRPATTDVSRSNFQARGHISSLRHRGRLALLAFAATAALLTGSGSEIEGAGLEPGTAAAPGLQFRNFADKEFVAARQSGSPVVLYFEADWCEPCKEMHARTFRDPSVLEAARGMELFRFDMTSGDGYVELMKKSFQVIGAPTVIVFAAGGREAVRRFGFIPPDDFTDMLAQGRLAPAGARLAPAGAGPAPAGAGPAPAGS